MLNASFLSSARFSFKHYVDGADNGPELINVTSSATILPPDQVLDVTRRSSMAAVPPASKPPQVVLRSNVD
jgi:hypothetical protein